MRLVIFLLFLVPCAALAEVSAILIGVSDYDEATGITDLRGPRNDVKLLRDVLSRRGVSQIEVIADGVDGASLPTRQIILARLAAKAESVAAGDFVYVHFSGHGTQQRDEDGDESDGLDEVFLPADTGFASAETGLIQNAITDDEIGQAIDRIRAAGANVWLVLDSCHSGSGLRAGGSEIATRYVDPESLGADLSTARAVAETATVADLPEGSAGAVVAFYASQSSELAREIRVSTSDGEGRFFGLFTSKLASRLDGGAEQSFRQLFQSVMRDMNDDSVPGAARMQTPLWEGDLIDAVVFGDASTAGLRRFEVRDDQFMAGHLHGFADGTLIGLVADAGDPEDAFLGYAQLEWTDATSAFLRPVSELCEPRMAMPCDVSGTLSSAAKFGQLVASPIDLIVRFSAPIDATSGGTLGADDPIRVSLEAAIDQSPEPVVLSEGDFDVEVAWDGQSLWFGPRTSLQGQLIGLSWRPENGPLAQTLTQIAKAEALDRLLSPLSEGASIVNPSPVRVGGVTLPVSVADVLPPQTSVSPIRECTRAQQRRDLTAGGELIEATEFKQCDALDFEAQGLTSGAWDVNRIHIDAKYCIHNEYVRIVDQASSIPLGDPMTLCSNCPDGYNAGDERLFIIVSEAANNSAALNLTGLIENCGTSFATRSPRAAMVETFLGTLVQGRATRGNLGAMGLSNIWVDRYRWTILPKEIALQRAGLE